MNVLLKGEMNALGKKSYGWYLLYKQEILVWT